MITAVKDFKATKVTKFVLGKDKIIVEVENTEDYFQWRMKINGEACIHTSHYQGLLEYKGYFLATDYWEGILPVFEPFRIQKVTKAKKAFK